MQIKLHQKEKKDFAEGLCVCVCVACLYLQYNGELLRRVPVLHAHGQPHLKRCQLLRKERAVLWTQYTQC